MKSVKKQIFPFAQSFSSLVIVLAILICAVPPCSGAGVSQATQVIHPESGAAFGWFSVDMDMSSDYLVVGGFTLSSSRSHAVHVYRRGIDDSWNLDSILRYEEGFNEGSNFGYSVSISDDGEEIFVGNPEVAKVHIYSRAGGSWTETGTVEAPVPGGLFAGRVKVSGDVLAVAAYRYPVGLAGAGRVYVFHRSSEGGWIEAARLEAPDGHLHGLLGDYLDIRGDLLVAGAAVTNFNGVKSQGAVYTWQKDDDNNWNYLGQLRAPDGTASDFFASIAIGDGVLGIGAYGRDVPTATGFNNDRGSVYVFKFDQNSPSGWSLVRIVKSADGEAGDWFGRSLAFDGDTLLVGASRKADADGVERGAAYAFKRDGGGIVDNWRQVRKFEYSGDAAAPWFGDDVVITPDSLVVGARRDGQIRWNEGSAAVFEREFDESAEPHPYDNWRHLHFPGQLMDRHLKENSWGNCADPDGDGLANSVEYLAGLDPNTYDSVQPITTELSATRLQYSILRVSGACASGSIERSTDLRHWSRFTPEQYSNIDGRDILEFLDLEGNSFYRIAVEED